MQHRQQLMEARQLGRQEVLVTPEHIDNSSKVRALRVARQQACSLRCVVGCRGQIASLAQAVRTSVEGIEQLRAKLDDTRANTVEERERRLRSAEEVVQAQMKEVEDERRNMRRLTTDLQRMLTELRAQRESDHLRVSVRA